VQATSRALAWARATPREQVVARFEQIVQRRKRNENAEPLKYWHSTGVASLDGRLSDREFQVWIDWLVRDGQLARGQLEAKDLYTNEFHAGGAS